MEIVTTAADMGRQAARARGAGHRIGFVPTMGALHAGHLALLAAARARTDFLVASVFVNPTQFGPHEDLARYPRPLATDQAACAASGVDVFYGPSRAAMYAPDHSVYVQEDVLARHLCGPHRPGHFRGVLTVVAQLFHDVQPDVAVFGQKDAQQARLIQRMVRDLHFRVAVLIAPTVREPDGLALSSRNQYLSPAERQRARCLSAALTEAEARYAGGALDARACCTAMRAQCMAGDLPVVVEYAEAVDLQCLAPVDTLTDGTLLALCVRIGTTRLIDNVILGRGRVAPSFGLI